MSLSVQLHTKTVELLEAGQSERIPDLFCEPSIKHPFQGLETRYLQEKFYKENFNLLVLTSGSMASA